MNTSIRIINTTETYPALENKFNQTNLDQTIKKQKRVPHFTNGPPATCVNVDYKPKDRDDAFLTDLSGLPKMFTTRKNSLPSPSLEDSFFPLSSSSSVSLSFALPSSTSSPDSSDSGGGIETDLILAAELGQALLEKNEELAASLEQSEKQVEVRIKPL